MKVFTVTSRCSVKKRFFKISQNSQGSTYTRVTTLIKSYGFFYFKWCLQMEVVLLKKLFWKTFVKLKGKHLCCSPFINKVFGHFQGLQRRNIDLKCFNPSWRRFLTYRNQSIYFQSKSMNWFLRDRDLRHERVKKDLGTSVFLWISRNFIENT